MRVRPWVLTNKVMGESVKKREHWPISAKDDRGGVSQMRVNDDRLRETFTKTNITDLSESTL